ncbi:hypothetical protein ACS25C_02370 [Dickeya undicola]|nr:hypothetical protein [Dickeya undicola]
MEESTDTGLKEKDFLKWNLGCTLLVQVIQAEKFCSPRHHLSQCL